MESLVKFTHEHLSKLNDAQLRKVLRKDFSFSRGTSIMSSEELVLKIIEFKDARQAEIDANSGLSLDVVYKDLIGGEWKISKIENGLVHIYNADGHKTNTTIASMNQQFSQKRYQQFTTNPAATLIDSIDIEEEDQGEQQIVDKPTVKSLAPKAKKKRSKSDTVRLIIKRESAAGNAFTSGSIMKMLEDEHGLKIHRSFCSSLIAKNKI